MKNIWKHSSFKMIINEESIYISDYKRLISIKEDYISLLTNTKKITVKGNKLALKKILEEELLIEGNIQLIEVSDEI